MPSDWALAYDPVISPLQPALHVVAWLLLGLAMAWGLRGAPLPRALRQRETWAWVLGAAAVHTLLWATVVPHAPWHTNNHGAILFADVVGHPWSRSGTLDKLHGAGVTAWFRGLASVLPVPHRSVFVGNLLLNLGAAGLLAALVASVTDRARTAGLVGAAWLLWPVTLRLSGTLSFYPAAVVGLLGLMLAAEVHGRRPDGRALPWLAVAAAVAFDTHVELLILGPLVTLAWLAVRWPRRLLTTLRHPGAWLAAILSTVLLLPRLGVHASEVFGLAASQAGPQDPVTRGLTKLSEARAAVWVCATGAALGLGAGGLSDDLDRTSPRSRGILGAVLLGLGALAMVRAPWLADPTHLYATAPTGGLTDLHPFFDPTVSPALWTAPLLPGAAWLAWRHPSLLAATTGTAALIGLLHTGEHDAFASWIRFGPMAGWAYLTVAAVGVATLTRALPSRAGVAAGVAWLALSLLHLPWVSTRFTAQLDHAVIAHALDTLPDDAVLASLGPADLADADADVAVDLANRHEAWRALGLDVVSLAEADAAGATHLLVSPPCYLPLVRPPGLTSLQRAVWSRGRWWRVALRDVPRPVRTLTPRLDRTHGLPDCPDDAITCALPDASGTCALHTCAERVPGRPLDHRHPACAAFADAHDAIPRFTQVPGPRVADTEESTLLHHAPELGLYRLEGASR